MIIASGKLKFAVRGPLTKIGNCTGKINEKSPLTNFLLVTEDASLKKDQRNEGGLLNLSFDIGLSW